MNEIANVHNDLIDLPLRKFNASEIDILTAICYKCNEKQTNKVVLPLDEIKKLADYRNKNNEMFLDDLKKTNSKLMALNFTIGTTREFTQFVLFPTFEVSDSKGTLTVQVHEKFAYLLNNLKNCYTSLELQESSSLKSSYSKGIYKKLREFRNSDNPFWKVKIDDFKEYLDVPKNYTQSDIDKRVLTPALNELSPYFEGLAVEKYSNKKKGQRGRPKIDGFIFSYKAEPKKERIKEPTQESIAKVTDWEKTPRFCPNCHRSIYKKQLKNENGVYYLYGHTDFKTGECDFTTNDYSVLLERYQIEQESNEPSTKEELKNKDGILKKISNIFK
jgi:plasmid replication initiation protein